MPNLRVILVDLPDALPSCLYAWEDLLGYANRLSIRRGGGEVFVAERWSASGPPPPRPDLILIPVRTAGGPLGREVAPSPPGLAALLRRWVSEGSVVGAACVGVFCVAETGLLDGRRATTHWSLAELFRRRFPAIRLEVEALVIEDGPLVLGGGMTAYFDVGLRLVRRFAGLEVANDCAAIFVLDPERRHQSPFAPVGWGLEDDADPVLAKAMVWALSQADLAFSVSDWAAAVALEKRTLERHARQVWGHGPAERLRRLRLERARWLLSSTPLGWELIAERCGSRDPAAFRRLFLTRYGQTPSEYRRRFRPR